MIGDSRVARTDIVGLLLWLYQYAESEEAGKKVNAVGRRAKLKTLRGHIRTQLLSSANVPNEATGGWGCNASRMIGYRITWDVERDKSFLRGNNDDHRNEAPREKLPVDAQKCSVRRTQGHAPPRFRQAIFDDNIQSPQFLSLEQ